MAAAQALAKLAAEPLVPLKSPRLYGADISAETAKRWYRVGFRSPVNGLRIKLEALFQGRVLYTSRDAYARFLVAVNQDPNPPTRSRRRPRARGGK
jgi:hypothetical protein